MSVDPRLLRPFVVLAGELHFGRAAERLHVTQPALSQQIARLERQLGVQLFARARTRVELTDAGAAMLAPARAAVEAAAAATEVARAYAGGEAGELALGLSPGAHYLAQALLAEFARRRPAVRVRAEQDNTGVLAERVAAGRLELALGFCTEPLGGAVDRARRAAARAAPGGRVQDRSRAAGRAGRGAPPGRAGVRRARARARLTSRPSAP